MTSSKFVKAAACGKCLRLRRLPGAPLPLRRRFSGGADVAAVWAWALLSVLRGVCPTLDAHIAALDAAGTSNQVRYVVTPPVLAHIPTSGCGWAVQGPNLELLYLLTSLQLANLRSLQEDPSGRESWTCVYSYACRKSKPGRCNRCLVQETY